jgi:hypothetical protein
VAARRATLFLNLLADSTKPSIELLAIGQHKQNICDHFLLTGASESNL